MCTRERLEVVGITRVRALVNLGASRGGLDLRKFTLTRLGVTRIIWVLFGSLGRD